MTISKTYFQCREDNLYYPDPIWYGNDYTILMDEDGCFIWVTHQVDPETVLRNLGIDFGGITQEFRAKRVFRNEKGKETFRDCVTFRFALKGKIPKSDSKKKGRTLEYIAKYG